MLSTKAVLTGNFGVGKTSLFNRFVYQKFSDAYRITIGVRVEKKIVTLNGQKANIILWDIEGQAQQQKVPTSYFLGASTILYVFDLSRPSTFQDLCCNVSYLEQLVPSATIKLIANKCDLVTEAEIQHIRRALPYPIDLITSAKSGENVEALFKSVGQSILPVC